MFPRHLLTLATGLARGRAISPEHAAPDSRHDGRCSRDRPDARASCLLSLSELPVEVARSVPRAFYFWQMVSALVTIWLIVRLRNSRASIANKANGEPATQEFKEPSSRKGG